MAILNTNEMMFTAFEPKLQNRFVMYIDGIPSISIRYLFCNLGSNAVNIISFVDLIAIFYYFLLFYYKYKPFQFL